MLNAENVYITCRVCLFPAISYAVITLMEKAPRSIRRLVELLKANFPKVKPRIVCVRNHSIVLVMYKDTY